MALRQRAEHHDILAARGQLQRVAGGERRVRLVDHQDAAQARGQIIQISVRYPVAGRAVRAGHDSQGRRRCRKPAQPAMRTYRRTAPRPPERPASARACGTGCRSASGNATGRSPSATERNSIVNRSSLPLPATIHAGSIPSTAAALCAELVRGRLRIPAQAVWCNRLQDGERAGAGRIRILVGVELDDLLAQRPAAPRAGMRSAHRSPVGNTTCVPAQDCRI